MYRDDIYRISPNQEAEGVSTVEKETPNAYQRVDSPVPAFPDDERLEHLDRREAALNARIAQFETIVRKTKLEMAQMRDDLTEREAQIGLRSDDLARREQAIRIRLDELTQRENAFDEKLAKISQNESAYLARNEEILRREADLQQRSEEFESRTAAVLGQINEQKRTLEQLLARIG